MEKRVMSKKQLSEKELVEGITPYTAHADELAAAKLDEFYESDYKAALKRIEYLFDTAEPETPRGDELERLAALVEEYEDKHFRI